MKIFTKHHYLFYTIIFVLTVLVTFGPHLIGGGTLIWNGDGISQHYPALVHFHNDLQNLLFHGRTPSLWQWQIGLGQDYLQTFSYYVLGDPFVYPSVFFPASFLPDYYSIAIIVRLYCAGISFIYAARKFLSQSRSFSLALSGMVYVFSGYTAYSSFAHPFFLNPLILFPLLLVAIRRVLKKGSVVPLILMVALTLVVNFYFAYILAAGAVVYWLIELIIHREYRRWQNIGRVILGALIGFLISAVLFVPSLYFLLNSARSGGAIANGLKVYSLSYYLSLPGSFLIPQGKPEFWLMGGFMILGLLGLIFVLKRFKKYRVLAISFLVAFVCLLLPIFGGILNGFSSPSNRWLLLMLFPIAISAVILLDSKIQKSDFVAFIGFGCIAVISLFITSAFGHYKGDLGMLTFQYLLVIICLWQNKLNGILAFLTIFNAASIILSVEPFNINATNHLLSKQAVLSLVARQEGYEKKTVDDYKIGSKDQNRPTFTRSYIDTQLPSYAYHPSLPILSSINSFETYWSLENGDVYNFMKSLGVSSAVQNDVTGNADLRNILLNYLGVSTISLNQDSKIIPASYQNYDSTIYNNQKTYLSNNAFPLMYFPTYVISKKSFDQMTPTQKEASLLDSVVADFGQEKSKMARKVKKVSFYDRTIKYSNGENVKFTSQTPEQLKLVNPSGQVVLLLPANRNLKDTELHLEFIGIQYKPFNFNELWQANIKDYEAQHFNDNLGGLDDFQNYDPEVFKYRWLARNYLKLGRTPPGYELSAEYLDRINSFKQLSPDRLSGYEVIKDVTMNLGPADEIDKEQWIKLNTTSLAHYAFDLDLVSVPSGDLIDKSAQKIRRQSHDNLDFKIKSDLITLKVKHPLKSVVATTIPYSPGWTINHGQLIKVNGAFIGINLQKGQKDYVLSYRTPYLSISKLISLIGLIFTIIWGTIEFIIKIRKNI